MVLGIVNGEVISEITVLKFSQLKNSKLPMARTEAGMVMDCNDTHSNALLSITAKFSGKEMERSDEQCANAACPIWVTLAGMLTPVKSIQSLKA